jgi:methylthioribose-1-phosphate isomerase
MQSHGSSEQGAAAMEVERPEGVYISAEDVPLTLWWDAAVAPEGALRLVDQTRLPGTYAVVTCATLPAVARAIRTLQVRGAPAIGVAAAYGLALSARDCSEARAEDGEQALGALAAAADTLRATRPTAVNLGWALDRVLGRAHAHLQAGGTPTTLPGVLLDEAQSIAAEDNAACRAMGALGAELIADGDVLLTHCNAGSLATAGMGTALAPILTAHQHGKRVRVFVDETRPVLQGARLTTWELARAGVPHTLITDNMAAHFMRSASIRGVFVGADRIAANGDVANKIGTYGLAVLARAHAIPLYVVAPCSTIDRALADGSSIPIEERSPDEVRRIGGVLIAPADVLVANPAFDVTPGHLVAAIITEAGIARAPYITSLAALFDSR